MTDSLVVLEHWDGRFFNNRADEAFSTPWDDQVDVLVLPSYTEGLPNVLLDAMLCGIPVVASSVGGIPDLVRGGKAGLLVPPGNPEALREALEKMLTDELLRTRIIRQGNQVAQDYAIDVAIKPLVRSIKELHSGFSES